MEFDKLQKILSDNLGIEPDEIRPEARFVEDLGADSLDVLELVMAIEEEFDIEIPEESLDGITTVQDAVDLIKKAL